jgi:hypothetical protein
MTQHDVIVYDLTDEQAASVAGGGFFSFLAPLLPYIVPRIPGVLSSVLGFLGYGTSSSRC